MLATDCLMTAAQKLTQVASDWLPANQVRPLILKDAAVVWLEHHHIAHGFQPDTSCYELVDFITDKAHHFEVKRLRGMALMTTKASRSRLRRLGTGG